ncbi:MAG TPA: hypothetical protein VGJ84_13450, partial [Polyangiaceae bacterium]
MSSSARKYATIRAAFITSRKDETVMTRRFRFGAASLMGLLVISTRALGTTWNVSNVAELDAAIAGMQTGDEIVIAAGTYPLSRTLWMHTPGVTIRGATGNRNDVILEGGGMNTRGVDEGISVGADDVAIKDLTIQEFYYNGIHTRAENDADRTLIS